MSGSYEKNILQSHLDRVLMPPPSFVPSSSGRKPTVFPGVKEKEEEEKKKKEKKKKSCNGSKDTKGPKEEDFRLFLSEIEQMEQQFSPPSSSSPGEEEVSSSSSSSSFSFSSSMKEWIDKASMREGGPPSSDSSSFGGSLLLLPPPPPPFSSTCSSLTGNSSSSLSSLSQRSPPPSSSTSSPRPSFVSTTDVRPMKMKLDHFYRQLLHIQTSCSFESCREPGRLFSSSSSCSSSTLSSCSESSSSVSGPCSSSSTLSAQVVSDEEVYEEWSDVNACLERCFELLREIPTAPDETWKTSLEVQLQTRTTDWLCGELRLSYFMDKLKEAETYLNGMMRSADRPVADRPVADRPVADRPVADRPVADRPKSSPSSSSSTSTSINSSGSRYTLTFNTTSISAKKSMKPAACASTKPAATALSSSSSSFRLPCHKHTPFKKLTVPTMMTTTTTNTTHTTTTTLTTPCTHNYSINPATTLLAVSTFSTSPPASPPSSPTSSKDVLPSSAADNTKRKKVQPLAGAMQKKKLALVSKWRQSAAVLLEEEEKCMVVSCSLCSRVIPLSYPPSAAAPVVSPLLSGGPWRLHQQHHHRTNAWAVPTQLRSLASVQVV